MLKILPLKKWKVTFADGSYVVVDARSNWEAVKVAKPMSRFTTVHAAPVIGWNRKVMRKNVDITSEMVKGAKGEGSKLLERLSKIDRNSSEARKIRRQLRKLGISLSKAVSREHLRKKVVEGKIKAGKKKVRELRETERKAQMELPLKRKRSKIWYTTGEGLDQVLDTAQVLTQRVGYKSKPELVKRLMEIYPRLTEEKAEGIANNVLIKKNPRKMSLRDAAEKVITSYLRKQPTRKEYSYWIEAWGDGLISKKELVKKIKGLLIGRKGALPPQLRKNSPSGATEIYGKIIAIEAQKGSNSTFPKENFRHEFKPGSKIFGLPDGSILIKGKKKLWKKFKY